LEKEFPKVIEIPQIHPEIRENTKRKREREISSPRKNTKDDITEDKRRYLERNNLHNSIV
jgi:hypothetical protein